MDLDCIVREKNAGFGHEMLPEAIEHFVKDHVTNEKVRRKIQAAVEEYDELSTLVKKRKLRWFGHVSMFLV